MTDPLLTEEKLKRDLVGTVWEVTTYHKGAKSDDLIVQITTKFKGLSGWWRKFRGDLPVVYKVAFVGKGFDWLMQPRCVPITDTTIKYRLYDLWFERSRDSWVRD